MLRLFLAAGFALAALPVTAQTEKEVSCAFQADVVDAIRQARLEKVGERDVQKTILDADPEWPDNYDRAIPFLREEKREEK